MSINEKHIQQYVLLSVEAFVILSKYCKVHFLKRLNIYNIEIELII